MAINIKNDETQKLTKELAHLTGESVTTAVTIAVRERLDRVRGADRSVEDRAARAVELGRKIAATLGPTPLRIEDLYDDAGLPR